MQRTDEEKLTKRILEWCPPGRRKKGKISKVVDAGGYNRNESEGNWRLGVDRQGRVEKENKFTLGTNRCENIKNLYINKKKIGQHKKESLCISKGSRFIRNKYNIL